jgi:hypothetical protein
MQTGLSPCRDLGSAGMIHLRCYVTSRDIVDALTL